MVGVDAHPHTSSETPTPSFHILRADSAAVRDEACPKSHVPTQAHSPLCHSNLVLVRVAPALVPSAMYRVHTMSIQPLETLCSLAPQSWKVEAGDYNDSRDLQLQTSQPSPPPGRDLARPTPLSQSMAMNVQCPSSKEAGGKGGLFLGPSSACVHCTGPVRYAGVLLPPTHPTQNPT